MAPGPLLADTSVAARERRIPEATVARLPLYERILTDLLGAGTGTVSSTELAERAHVNASNVRKDLSFFGSFGTRGRGYDVVSLARQIAHTLGADRDWPIAIVGVGNLGRALASSDGFAAHGFRVASLFDVHPGVVGRTVAGLRVRHAGELSRGPQEGPAVPAASIGVIATPSSAAQTVADLLVAAHVPSILNFAPRVLSVPEGVLVRHVDLSRELQVMSFFLTRTTT